MIQIEFYRTREDGVNLYRTFTDQNVYIRQEQSGVEYPIEAIDVENAPYTYVETDIPIEPVEPTDEAKQKAETDLTVSDTLEMLGELGVDVSD